MTEETTWQARVADLGKPNPEKQGREFLQPGIYSIQSMYELSTLAISAKGLLEIAEYVEQNRDKLKQEAATPQALKLAADAEERQH